MMIIKAHFSYKNNYETLENSLNLILSSSSDSVTKWNLVTKELNLNVQSDKTKKNSQSKYTVAELCLKEIKLNLTYPRLDINVSKHINHLLKSPFCIHPKTGLISVPLNEDDILYFDIEKIPAIEESLGSIDSEK
jgi:DNA primase small subunit